MLFRLHWFVHECVGYTEYLVNYEPLQIFVFGRDNQLRGYRSELGNAYGCGISETMAIEMGSLSRYMKHSRVPIFPFFAPIYWVKPLSGIRKLIGYPSVREAFRFSINYQVLACWTCSPLSDDWCNGAKKAWGKPGPSP